jgi:hypothetical protein
MHGCCPKISDLPRYHRANGTQACQIGENLHNSTGHVEKPRLALLEN